MLKLKSSFNEGTYEVSFTLAGENKDDFNIAASVRHAVCGILHQIMCIANQKPKTALYLAITLHNLCGLVNKTIGGNRYDVY